MHMHMHTYIHTFDVRLLAGEPWRVNMPEKEAEAELAKEAAAFGSVDSLPPRELPKPAKPTSYLLPTTSYYLRWADPLPPRELPKPAKPKKVKGRANHGSGAVFDSMFFAHSSRARFLLAQRLTSYPDRASK